MSEVLSTQGLTKHYGKVRALDGLTFSVDEGAVYGLLGPNGAGKTTALKILVNLQQPTAGEAHVLGVNTRKVRGRRFEQIGYVSENQKQPGWMTLAELYRYLKPYYPTWDDARAKELAVQLEIPMDRRIKHMSRGMQMKVAVASSIAYRPKLLLMDEPFSGLDPLTREELTGTLAESAAETTMVISTHDLADLETFASHIGLLREGRMDFSEELPALSGRFREMTVTLEGPQAATQWPEHWLQREVTSAMARFVETRYDAEGTTQQIHGVFQGVRNIEANPMPLRSIFVALARSKRAAA